MSRKVKHASTVSKRKSELGTDDAGYMTESSEELISDTRQIRSRRGIMMPAASYTNRRMILHFSVALILFTFTYHGANAQLLTNSTLTDVDAGLIRLEFNESSWYMPAEVQPLLPFSEDFQKHADKIIWNEGMSTRKNQPEAITKDIADLRQTLAESLMRVLSPGSNTSGLNVANNLNMQNSLVNVTGITLRRIGSLSDVKNDLSLAEKSENTAKGDPPLVYISASSTQSYENRPEMAFDSNPETLWISKTWNKSEDFSQWIEYSFEEPKTLLAYSLSSYPAVSKEQVVSTEFSMSRLGGAVYGGPTSWTLNCTKDGVVWTQVHDVRQSQPWVPGEVRQYTLNNDDKWRFCRIYIHSVPQRPDGQMQVALSEINFSKLNSPNDVSDVPVRPAMAMAIQKKKACSFPFIHQNVLHTSCIPYQEKLWCKDEQDQWIQCDQYYGTERTSSPGSSMRSVSDSVELPLTAERRQQTITSEGCAFPFMHFGASYDECIPFDNRNWCKNQRNEWLVCRSSQKKVDVTETPMKAEDWYLKLPVNGSSEERLNALEIKPLIDQAKNTTLYQSCKMVNRRNFKLYHPTKYKKLPLGDDEAAHVKFPGDFAFPFYGKLFRDMFVGSNGYITFGTADTNYMGTEEAHFGKKRLSVLFTDINVSKGGEVLFADLSNSVAVSWFNVTLKQPGGKSIPNQSFQAILFKDGHIWMGYDNVVSNAPLIGVSTGSANPANRTRIELDDIDNC